MPATCPAPAARAISRISLAAHKTLFCRLPRAHVARDLEDNLACLSSLASSAHGEIRATGRTARLTLKLVGEEFDERFDLRGNAGAVRIDRVNVRGLHEAAR